MRKTKDAKIYIRLGSDLERAAKRKAAQQDRPLSQVVRELLQAWLATPTQGGAP